MNKTGGTVEDAPRRSCGRGQERTSMKRKLPNVTDRSTWRAAALGAVAQAFPRAGSLWKPRTSVGTAWYRRASESPTCAMGQTPREHQRRPGSLAGGEVVRQVGRAAAQERQSDECDRPCADPRRRPAPRAARAAATRITGRKRGGVRAVPRRNISRAPPCGEAPTPTTDSTAPTAGSGQ